MSQFYILVEGVNIYANILDTNQLSVMRGSSFILKDAIDYITDRDKFKNKLKAISTGASSGLYRVINGDPQELVNDISEELNTDPDFSLLTFIVVSCEADDLLIAKEKLLTKLRIQQMQSISQVPDRTESTNYENFPDQLEGRRIAAKGDKIKDDKQVSESVLRRYRYGQIKKQDFYFDEKAITLIKENTSDEEKEQIDHVIKSLTERKFCEHFEGLAEAENKNYRKLNNKIAVIYMDGNSFSKVQRDFINSHDDKTKGLENFDKYIQGERANLIYKLLEEMAYSSKSFKNATTQDGRIRLETLLWGGDESIFVVPAWLGFELLQTIFALTKNWKLTITIDNNEEKEIKLTHAAGIVFCSAKTPIRNIRSLAQAIADDIKEVKDEEKGIDGRAQNAWGYMVLESIDHPSNNDINDFNHKHYGENLTRTKPKFIPASSDDFVSFKTSANKLINDDLLSTRQLYKIAHTIKNTSEPLSKSWKDISELKELPKDKKLNPIEEQEFRLLQTCKKKNELLTEIKTVATLFSINIDTEEPEEFNNRIWLWVYLFDLWEYICPVVSDNGDKS